MYDKGQAGRKNQGTFENDGDLNFLLILKKEELERLVACIRDRVD